MGVFVGQMGVEIGAANVVFFVDVDSNAGGIADRKIGAHLQIVHGRIFGRQPVFFPIIRIKIAEEQVLAGVAVPAGILVVV
ncbi:MAG: hypothetical protein ACLVLA_05275 [Acidaminococcus intestini]